MPLITYFWLVGPLLLLVFVVAYSMRRSAARRDTFDTARFRGQTSEAGLAAAMTDALTRLRGQELAHQARHEALDGFMRQVLEAFPSGVLVLGCEGNLRLANQEALRWLGVQALAEGQVLWTLDGTESLRHVAQACLQADARRDASVEGPGVPGTAVPVTTIPLRTPAGETDGVLCLVHVERVC